MTDIYTAIHKKTKTEYLVVGKDATGTLVRLKEKRSGAEIVTNRCYYTFFKNGKEI